MERKQLGGNRTDSKRRHWSAGVMAAALLSLAGVSWAQPPWGGPGRGPGPHGWCGGDMLWLKEMLGLTDEQVSKIESLRSEFLKEAIDLDAQIQKKRLELGDLFRDPQAKQEKIEAVQKELNSLTAQKHEKAQDYRLKARGVLTPEQIGKLPPGCSFGNPQAGAMCPGGPGWGRGPGPGGGKPWCPYAM